MNRALTACYSKQATKQLVFSTESSSHPPPSASDSYHLAVSLLDSITAHSSPLTPATHATQQSTVQIPSQSRIYNWIESRLGSNTAKVVGTTKSALSYLYAGSDSSRRQRSDKNKRDWSLRSAVTGFKKLVTNYAALSRQAIPGRTRQSPKGWQAKLEAASGLRAGDVVLEESEVDEAMQQVVRLARQAAEAGSPEAWVLLGDLHMVSSQLELCQVRVIVHILMLRVSPERSSDVETKHDSCS